MFPFSTLSLRKWYLTSVCLVLECNTGFLATLMALITEVTQRVCDPKQLWETTSSSDILGFCRRMSYTRLFARRPRNKRRTQKLAHLRSWLPIDSTPRKVGIRKKEAKEKRTPSTKDRAKGCIEYTWRSTWPLVDVKSLVMPKNERTDTQKTDCPFSSPSSIRGSQSCSVLLVYGLSILICIQRCSRTHRCRQGLRVVHFELFDDVLRVLG
jgi:hypothetical protein